MIRPPHIYTPLTILGVILIFLTMAMIPREKPRPLAAKVIDTKAESTLWPLLQILKTIAVKSHQHGLPLRLDEERLILIPSPSESMFDLGKADLNASGQKDMGIFISALNWGLSCFYPHKAHQCPITLRDLGDCPEGAKKALEPPKMVIRGHADGTPFKAVHDGNRKLSEQRSAAVLAVFQSCLGGTFEGYGVGEKEPAYADTKDPKNRRIEVKFD